MVLYGRCPEKKGLVISSVYICAFIWTHTFTESTGHLQSTTKHKLMWKDSFLSFRLLKAPRTNAWYSALQPSLSPCRFVFTVATLYIKESHLGLQLFRVSFCSPQGLHCIFFYTSSLSNFLESIKFPLYTFSSINATLPLDKWESKSQTDLIFPEEHKSKEKYTSEPFICI